MLLKSFGKVVDTTTETS